MTALVLGRSILSDPTGSGSWRCSSSSVRSMPPPRTGRSTACSRWFAPTTPGRAATAAERAAIADRLLEAVEAYVGALRAREDARAAKLGLDAANAMRAAAAERFEEGQVPELDTLRAAAREGEARVREIGARR